MHSIGGDRFLQLLSPSENSSSEPAISGESSAPSAPSLSLAAVTSSGEGIVEPIQPLKSKKLEDEKTVEKKRRRRKTEKGISLFVTRCTNIEITGKVFYFSLLEDVRIFR